MKKSTKITVLVAVALLGTSTAMAKPDHAGKGKGHEKAKQHQSHKGGTSNDSTADRVGDAIVGGLLTAVERELIGDYYAKPANQISAKPLPPGIAKNLKRGKPLPPGIAKRGLPDNLYSQLNKREGIQPRIIGNNLVLEEIATGIIIDVVREIIR